MHEGSVREQENELLDDIVGASLWYTDPWNPDAIFYWHHIDIGIDCLPRDIDICPIL